LCPWQVVAAAELALSVLPNAGALNPNEIQRAIQQCKEQSHTMLEKVPLLMNFLFFRPKSFRIFLNICRITNHIS
jgi:hypothetical protein